MNTNEPHPVHQVYDGIFDSASGRKISLINPTADQIILRDLAKALSNICRFGGQIEEFYSVAEHTLLVWFLSPQRLKKVAILHDTPEACGIGDAIKPFKVMIADTYGPFEDMFADLIFKKYHVDIELLKDVKPYDLAATGIEHGYHRQGDQYLKELFKEINELLPGETPFVKLYYLMVQQFGQYER